MVTRIKKGLIPYNIVVGGLHFLLGVLILRVTYHLPGDASTVSKGEPCCKGKALREMMFVS